MPNRNSRTNSGSSLRTSSRFISLPTPNGSGIRATLDLKRVNFTRHSNEAAGVQSAETGEIEGYKVIRYRGQSIAMPIADFNEMVAQCAAKIANLTGTGAGA